MLPHQHIRKCFQQFCRGRFVGKFVISAVLGLLFLVATFIVSAPSAQAYASTSCSRSDQSYHVVEGDTLSKIAFGYDTSWSALASHNHLANPNLIYIGQTVCIPAQGAPTSAPTPAQQKTVLTYSAPASSGSIPDMINQVFGPYGRAAINVATCESGLNPNAYNPSGASGLFQILYPSTWDSTSQAAKSPFDAQANIIAAHEIFVRDGYSWREWSCQP